MGQIIGEASYVQAWKVHLGVIAMPARTAREHKTDRRCKLGCATPGTTHHIMQVCPSVQLWWIVHHNNVTHLVSPRLRCRGYTAINEPHIPTRRGTWILNIVCWRGESSFVPDVQVYGDANALTFSDAHQLKVSKYDIPEVLAYMRQRAGGLLHHRPPRC